MKKCTLIINADDFGYNSQVNKAILSSFSSGLCSSTTIIPNMPGFKEACDLAHENKMEKSIGVHLVLSAGEPLTENIRKCSRICNEDGTFSGNQRQQLFKISLDERNCILEEITAQIDRCKVNGLPITHIDSHHHVHIEWGVFKCVLEAARDKGIPFIRLARHIDPNSKYYKNLYRRYVNYKIRKIGNARVDYFGMVEDYLRLEKKGKQVDSFEIMIHPAFNENNVIIDQISKQELNTYIKQLKNYQNAVSYGT